MNFGVDRIAGSKTQHFLNCPGTREVGTNVNSSVGNKDVNNLGSPGEIQEVGYFLCGNLHGLALRELAICQVHGQADDWVVRPGKLGVQGVQIGRCQGVPFEETGRN